MDFYWPKETYTFGASDALDTPEWRKRWPNFSPHELQDEKGDVLVLNKALDALQFMRFQVDRPLIINSAYRNPAHNRRVGGSRRSMHMYGHAFDLSLGFGDQKHHDPIKLERLAIENGFNGIGRYPRYWPKTGWIHIDMRDRRAVWGPKNWKVKL